MKSTPILSLHRRLGAEIGSFAGWSSPLWFSTVKDEHKAVRTHAGIFDISHMTRTIIRGGGAIPLLQKILTYDVSSLKEGRMKYCLILNEDAGIIDDVTVFRVSADTYLMISNASTREKVLSSIKRHLEGDVFLEDITESSAQLAIQGPASARLVSRWSDEEFDGLKWFAGKIVRVGDCPIIVTRSGYTGEDGFELCILCGGGEMYEKVFQDFLSMGAVPCGLACRDILRLEAGYPLYGQDMDENMTPVEARLMWAVRMENTSFIGRQALVERMEKKPEKLLVGMELMESGVPRHGYRVLDASGRPLGHITSGGMSYSRGCGISLGYVLAEYAVDGAEVYVDLRGRKRRASVRLEPFVKLNIPRH